jgi:hypothetical protein
MRRVTEHGDKRSARRRVIGPSRRDSKSLLFWDVYEGLTARDAGRRDSIYVQISDSVTKVLIRKQMRGFPGMYSVTNLET